MLKGLSLTIKPREKIGIVGRTGCGKSTLMSTLFRIVEPTGGRVLIDGHDLAQVPLHQLRSKLALVPQVRAGLLPPKPSNTMETSFTCLNLFVFLYQNNPRKTRNFAFLCCFIFKMCLAFNGWDISFSRRKLYSCDVYMQDPVVFSGTVRDNLDPFNACEGDAAIWSALRQTGMADTVTKLQVCFSSLYV